MKSVDVIVEREDRFATGFRVYSGREHGKKTPLVYVADFNRGPTGESCSRLRGMDPDTARRVAVELAAMADYLENEAAPPSGVDQEKK